MRDIWQGTLVKGFFNPFPQRCHNPQVERHSYREMWIREKNDRGLGCFGLVSAVATLLETHSFFFGSLSSVFLEIACSAWGFYFMSCDSHRRPKDSAAIDTSISSVTNVWMRTLSQGLYRKIIQDLELGWPQNVHVIQVFKEKLDIFFELWIFKGSSL